MISTGVTRGVSPAEDEGISPEDCYLAADEGVSRKFLEDLMIDVEIERLAIAGKVDLVREVVEGYEVERVADRGAAHRGTDLNDCVRLAFTGRVDADRRGARFRIRLDDNPLDPHQIRPGHVPRLRPIAELCAGLVRRFRGEITHLGKRPGLLFEIGNDLGGPYPRQPSCRDRRPPPADGPRSQARGRRRWG